MAKKQEIKTEIKEREYVIPLRVEWRKVPKYQRAAKAIKAIKEFLVRHMKIYDRDLKKIKIDKYLNEQIWIRGIKMPPHKIKVKAIKNGENVQVELINFPDKLKYKKLREEKLETKAKESKEKKKTLMQKMKEGAPKKSEEKKEDSAEKKVEEKEKAKAGEEAIKKLEKTKSKEMKHSAKEKINKKTQPVRKALAK